MLKIISEIEATAFKARREFEERTISRSLLRSLYLEYSPNVLDIDGFLDFAERIFPVGNCGLTAVYLRHLYGAGEIVDGLYEIEDHQFLSLGKLATELEVELGVDITSDQFGGPKVYVGPIVEPWSRQPAA